MPKCELCRQDVLEPGIRQRAPREISILFPREGNRHALTIFTAAQSAVQTDDPPGIADRPRWWLCDACVRKQFTDRVAEASPDASGELQLPDDLRGERGPRLAPRYAEFDEIRRAIRRVRRRWRRVNIRCGAYIFCSALLAASLAVLGFECGPGMSPAMRRGATFGLGSLVVFGFGYWVLLRLFRNLSDEQFALLVERTYGQIDNGLINAVRLANDPDVPSIDLVGAAMRETLDRMEGIDVTAAIDRRWAKRFGLSALVLLILTAGLAALFPSRVLNAAQRLVRPAGNLAKIGKVKILAVKPGDRVGKDALLSGDTLSVEVKIESLGSFGLEGTVEYREPKQDIRTVRLRMSDETTFHGELREVKAALDYRVRIGDSASRHFKVEVVAPPRIVGIGLEYRFPKYTGLPPKTEEDSDGSIRAVVGTTFNLRIRSNHRMRSGRMLVGQKLDEVRMNLEADASTAALPEFLPIESDKTYTLEIVDERGNRNRNPVQRYIRALVDAKPTIKIIQPGKDQIVPPGGKMAIVARASDDYGMSSAELVARVRRKGVDGKWGTVYTWAKVPEGKRIVLSREWVFDKKTYQTGDIVRYYIKVADNNDVSGPGIGKSSEHEVRVEDPEQIKKEQIDKYGSWQERLQKILQDQVGLRDQTLRLEKMTGVQAPKPAAGAPANKPAPAGPGKGAKP